MPSSYEIERCRTGIPGLDYILGGGFPKERSYLIQGEPGAGKTTLGLQFLLEGVKQGEKSLYVTLSETKQELEQVAHSHGWDIDQLSILDLTTLEQRIPVDATTTLFHPYEVELSETTKVILSEMERLRPERVIFDSLSEMRMLTENPLRYRRQMLFLKQFFSKQKCTVLMLDDKTSSTTRDLQINSIAHGVIDLLHDAPEYGAERRRITILKIRGVPFKGGFHDFVIKTGGLAVFPRLVAADHSADGIGETVSSGISNLDQLLGGGINRGTSTLTIGPAGSGKSSLAMQFAASAAGRGDKVLLFLFEETTQIYFARASKLGLPLGKYLQDGLIRVVHVDPAEYSPGELSHNVRTAVLEDGLQVVVLDSLNGYINAMPAERFLMLQLHELLTFLNTQNVTTFLILAQHGLVGNMQTPADLTYLADSVILLRYFEAGGEIRQAISVMKKRSGVHERLIRELHMTSHGLQVGEPLRQFHGVLTGVPVYQGQEKQNQQ
jgi:circadian clock protein KaiC